MREWRRDGLAGDGGSAGEVGTAVQQEARGADEAGVVAQLRALDAQAHSLLVTTVSREQRIAASSLRSVPTRHVYQSEALQDTRLLAVECPACGRRTAFDTPWFDAGREKYLALARCPQHGLAFCQMHFKRVPNGTLVMHQRAYAADDSQIADTREKYRLYLLTPPRKRHHRLSMPEESAPDCGTQAGS